MYKRPDVEREHVQKVYDCIAQQWHKTRYKPWPRVTEFIKTYCTQPAQIVADIGCGNGKNIPAFAETNAYCIACDFSLEQVKVASHTTQDAKNITPQKLQKPQKPEKPRADFLCADALILPYRSNLFDVAICIAVLHHISSYERRLRIVSESLRILRIGGVALFYVWAFEQKEFEARSKHKFNQSDVMVPFHFRTHGEHPKPPLADSHIPDHALFDAQKNAIVFQRYCHVFVQGELESLINEIPNVKIKNSYYDEGNWAVVVEKVEKL